MAAPPPTAAPVVYGLRPWFPWPLSRWRWLNEPVAAQRVAALRIALGLLLFFDVASTFYPNRTDYFGPDSLGDPKVFDYRFEKDRDKDKEKEPTHRWTLLPRQKDVEAERGRAKGSEKDYQQVIHRRITLLMASWVLASFLLTIGFLSRLAAIWCWVMAVSVESTNPYITNAGDIVRTITLFFLMLSPSGAAWSVDAWLRRRFGLKTVPQPHGQLEGVALVRYHPPRTEPFLIPPWTLRLLFLQMMIIYSFNGWYKALGLPPNDTWDTGTSLHNALCDLTLSRFSYSMLDLPFWMTRLMTLSVKYWEIWFAPIVIVPWHTLADLWKKIPNVGAGDVLFRYTREIFLFFGFCFHVGILVSMEIGGFAPYMMCLYLPLIPWERWRVNRKGQLSVVPPVADAPGSPS